MKHESEMRLAHFNMTANRSVGYDRGISAPSGVISMRRNLRLVSTLVAAAFMWDAGDACAQRGGGGPGGSRGGFGGGDPNALWNQMSGGAESIDLNKSPQAKWMLFGAPAPADGKITKQMYQAGMAQKMAGGGRPMGGPGGPTAPPSATPAPGTGAPVVISVDSSSGDKSITPPGGPMGPNGMGGYGGGYGGGGPGGGGMGGGRGGNMWGDPEALFQRIDQNRDGKIGKDETKMLLPVFDQIDTGKDGFIDLAELKVYAAAQAAATPGGGQGGGWSGSPGGGGEQPKKGDIEEERPVVYRFGKLPKDFPYTALDKDEDGQVSLFEWRTQSSKSVDDFLDRDLNGDGFLTAEEWLRGTKTSLGGGDKSKSTTASSGGYPTGNMGGPRGGYGRNGPTDTSKDKEKEKEKEREKDKEKEEKKRSRN